LPSIRKSYIKDHIKLWATRRNIYH